MALISCPECGYKVDDSAPVCPQCGQPMSRENERSGASHTTIEAAAKRLRRHFIAANIIMLSSLVWLAVQAYFLLPPGFFAQEVTPDEAISALTRGETATPDPLLVPPLATLAIGIIWNIVTKARIWWYRVKVIFGSDV